MATGAEPTTLTSTPRSQPGIASLGVALYLVLIDAAVETFVSGSPVRWWVAGVVAAYFALSIGLWRYRRSVWEHMGWATRATESFFLLLALLAFTAWLPDGLTEGIRLLGQPTSRVLSLLTAVVIALAGVSLARRSWPRPWVKWVIGALTTYGLAALLKGMISGTSFPELFHGESFWSWLPRWLQGAFIGGLIIVPAEVIARAGSMLKAAPGAARTWELRQLVAMAMSVVLAVSGATNSGFGGPQPSAAEIVEPVAKSYQDLAEALAWPEPKAPLMPHQVANELGKLFPVLEKSEREIPRDTFDLQALIDKVGKDPQKLFEWVRDNTYFVPYRGLLRGDKGVLMDRLGNSLDRAMLLYAMLRTIGQPTRLARRTLTEAQAQDLLKRARASPALDMQTRSVAVTDAFVKQYVERSKLDVTRVRKILDQIRIQQRRVKEQMQRRVAAQASIIASALGHPPANVRVEQEAEQVRAATDHWWVQWQNGSNWIDLDPTLTYSQPDKPLMVLQADAEPNSLIDGILPDELVHKVVLRVVIEQLKGDQVKENTVLNETLRPAELCGVPIRLNNVPLNWPQDKRLFLDASDFKQIVLDQKEWLPVLSVGPKQVIQSGFNVSGDINTSPLAPLLGGGAGGLGHSIGNIFDAHGIGQVPSQTDHKSALLTAEWIEYEIISPGQPTRTIRREVFDILGPGRRAARNTALPQLSEEQRFARGLALTGETNILALACQLSPEFAEHVTAEAVLDDRPALLAMLHGVEGQDQQGLLDGGGKLVPSPTLLYGLAVARHTGSASPGSVYLDRPNILSSHHYFTWDSQSGLVLHQAFDIVANEVAVRSSSRPATLERLEQGVLDTNLEAILATRFLSSRPIKITENAAEMFDASDVASPGWKIIRGADNPLKEVGLSTDSLARADQDLKAGYVLIVPKTGPTLGGNESGWWRVDPRTGQTIGIGPRGWGQAVESTLLKAYLIITFTVLTFGCYVGHAVGQRQVGEKWDSRTWVICPVAAGLEVFAGAPFTLGTFIAALLANVVLIGYSQ